MRMIKSSCMFYMLPAVLLFSEVLMAQPKPAEYVNPFIGASTSVGAAGIYHGLGKTFPGAATPFGMVQVSPNTITGGDKGSGYSYEHTSIEGFAMTQMSGVGWYGDLGNFLIMPTTGGLKTSAGKPEGSVITDALMKGIGDFDTKNAYRLSANTGEKFGNGAAGFSPGGLSISNTLEYSYSDWCLSQMAAKLGNKEDAAKYSARAEAYKNVFDKEKGWFRPKDEQGKWLQWPAEGRLEQGYGCIESNPYQQGWFVPHDMPGMVGLMGGNASVVADLTAFFEKTPADMMWNNYYNHANEPVHHVAFLFNRLGAPWLTQRWTREICRRAYHNSVEGLVGNEDVGQMSAWYILAAIGLHPVCPGDTRYEITSTVFSKITIRLDPKYAKGKAFTVTAHHNSSSNIYIQSARLNGKAYNKCYIDYKEIISGGELDLEMGDKPNYKWSAAVL